jgi:Tol biopolymer transport system component
MVNESVPGTEKRMKDAFGQGREIRSGRGAADTSSRTGNRWPDSPAIGLALGACLCVVVTAAPTARATQSADFAVTELISLNPSGDPGDRDSFSPSISADGRFVAFASRAVDLVAGDDNNSEDVFVHDRLTGATVRVSVSSDGEPGNDDSYRPAISPDGRFVAFQSDAANLTPGDTNGATDVFLHDLDAGRTTRVSVGSGNGQANGASFAATLSAAGRVIVFHSDADNLVPDDSNRERDVFVHDRATGQTRRIAPPGDTATASWDAAVSADGRYVAFTAHGDWNARVGPTEDDEASEPPSEATVNRLTAGQIYVYDRERGAFECVSVGNDGEQGNADSFAPDISDDGRRVAFASNASNLVPNDANGATDVFVRDRLDGRTSRVSLADGDREADGESLRPAISGDGGSVAFRSRAENLTGRKHNGRSHVFVHDLATGQTRSVSVNSAGDQGDGNSDWPALSADGRFVVFESAASNLSLCDRNRREDVFVQAPRECEGRVLGDANGDGVANRADIDPFVLAVSDPCVYAKRFPHCDLLCNNDMNGDGAVDFFDIDDFVARIADED